MSDKTEFSALSDSITAAKLREKFKLNVNKLQNAKFYRIETFFRLKQTETNNNFVDK